MHAKLMIQDKCGFAAGDSNLSRYVRNNPTNFTDPSGLKNVPTGVSRALGWERGGSFPHGFIILDGLGFGFYEVNTHWEGQGAVVNSDLDRWPLNGDGKWYSTRK